MIVDNDRDITSLLTTVLSGEGLNVVTASNGQEALDLLKTGKLPHLILSDMCMPVMAGPELVLKLKSNSRTKDIPVILASASEGIEATGEMMGASACLKKPFHLKALTDLIRNQLLH